MKKIFFGCVFLLLFSHCELNQKFEKRTIEELFAALKNEKEFESDLNQTVLSDFLTRVTITELKKGELFERNYIFEPYKCDCEDKISIYYSAENDTFELNIYEEFFVKELDWCPETTYLFSFQVKHSEIKNFKLTYIAG